MRDFSVSIKKLIEDALFYVKEGIEENMDRFDRNASNRSVDSLEIHVEETSGYIKSDMFSWNVMERGRKHGKTPMGFYKIIEQWMYDKNISPDAGQSYAQAAKNIAWFIKQNGTSLHRGIRGHTTPNFDDIFTSRADKATKDLAEKISWFASVELEQLVNENL